MRRAGHDFACKSVSLGHAVRSARSKVEEDHPERALMRVAVVAAAAARKEELQSLRRRRSEMLNIKKTKHGASTEIIIVIRGLRINI